MNVRKSLVISFFEKYCRVVIGLATTMILSRLLTPRDIGIMSIGLAVVGLTHVLRDFGVSNYLIQEKELTRDRLRTTFGIAIASSWIMGGILALGSGAASRIYSEPGIRSAILVLSLNFLLIPFGSLVLVLLRRDSKFGSLSWINLVGGVAYSATAVALAWTGWGFISMAWASVAGTAVSVAMAYMKMPGHLKLLPNFSEWRRVINFGVLSAAASLVGEIGARGTDLIIGRVIGIPETGLYSKASGLGGMFYDNVLSAVSAVTLTKFAESHRSDKDIRDDFLNYMSHITVVAWPFFVYCGFMIFYVIRFLFGAQWDAAVEPGRILCIANFISVLACLNWVVFTAKGAMRTSLSLQTSVQIFGLTLVFIGCFGGLDGVASAAIVAAIYSVYVSFTHLRRLINVSLRDVLGATLKSLVVALVAGIPPLVTLLVSGDSSAHILPTLLVSGASTGMAWLAAVFVVNHPVKAEIIGFCTIAVRRARTWRPVV